MKRMISQKISRCVSSVSPGHRGCGIDYPNGCRRSSLSGDAVTASAVRHPLSLTAILSMFLLVVASITGCAAPVADRAATPAVSTTVSAPGVIATCRREDHRWHPALEADRGIGGTGKMVDRGMGGTGKVADKGLGGTGKVADKGLGGTGVVGVITGFGSICVNGVEIFYDEKTAVKMDGRAVEPSALKLGQVAAVFSRPGKHGLEAGIIVVNHALVGAIEAVDEEERTLRVLGVTVDAPAGAIVADASGKRVSLSDLKEGDSVAVSGLWKPNGHVDAARIDRADRQGDRVSATGLIKQLDSRRFVLSGIPVSLARANVLEFEASGHTALITGRWNGKRIEADTVELQPVTPFCVRARDLNLEGYVTAVEEDGSFRMLGTVRVVVSADSDIIGAKTIEKGMRVWVHGPVQPNRLVTARQIRVLAPARE